MSCPVFRRRYNIYLIIALIDKSFKFPYNKGINNREAVVGNNQPLIASQLGVYFMKKLAVLLAFIGFFSFNQVKAASVFGFMDNKFYDVSGSLKYFGFMDGSLFDVNGKAVDRASVGLPPFVPTDLCSNVDGVQSVVPSGDFVENGKCYFRPLDVKPAVDPNPTIVVPTVPVIPVPVITEAQINSGLLACKNIYKQGFGPEVICSSSYADLTAYLQKIILPDGSWIVLSDTVEPKTTDQMLKFNLGDASYGKDISFYLQDASGTQSSLLTIPVGH